LIATPVTPHRVKAKLTGARDYYQRKERSVFQDSLLHVCRHDSPAGGTPAVASFADAVSATAVSSLRTFEELHFVLDRRQRSKWPKIQRSHVISVLGTQSDKEGSDQEMNANHAYET
jgi:hypothetical protein